MLHIIFLMKICSNQKPLKMNHLVMTLKISKLELTIQIFFYTTHTKIGFSVEVKKQNKKQIQKNKQTRKENYLTTLTALELNSS